MGPSFQLKVCLAMLSIYLPGPFRTTVPLQESVTQNPFDKPCGNGWGLILAAAAGSGSSDCCGSCFFVCRSFSRYGSVRNCFCSSQKQWLVLAATAAVGVFPTALLFKDLYLFVQIILVLWERAGFVLPGDAIQNTKSH